MVKKGEVAVERGRIGVEERERRDLQTEEEASARELERGVEELGPREVKEAAEEGLRRGEAHDDVPLSRRMSI